MKKSYSRIRHTQETNLMLENRFLSEKRNRLFEQTSGNPVKQQISDLIGYIQFSLGWDFWDDADDLMKIYNKLLPLKGKKVGSGEIEMYKEKNSEEMNPNMPALKYFNMMWSRSVDSKYGVPRGSELSFIETINKVGEKTFFGGDEKTSDGKYTTKQVKEMIVDLINKG